MGTERNGLGRHWNKRVSFARHLAGAMKSISYSWKRGFDYAEAYLESEVLAFDREGRTSWSLELAPACRPTVEENIMEQEREAQILRLFATDREATCVILGLLDGMKRQEIMQNYGLTGNRHDAAVKRIRTKLGSINWSSR
jgi:hypothetical protein